MNKLDKHGAALLGTIRMRRMYGLWAVGSAIALSSAAIGGEETCEPSWELQIGQPGATGPVHALRVLDLGDGPRLYAGGFFSQIGASQEPRIGVWDGQSWSGLGGGAGNSAVLTIEGYHEAGSPRLFAGGGFDTIGGRQIAKIARWDGKEWTAVGGGVNLTVRALTVFDPGGGARLYVGGAFITAGGMSAKNIASWDGANWATLGEGVLSSVSGGVMAMAVHDDGDGPALFVGGDFFGAGGEVAENIARWDGQNWTTLGQGLNGPVHALAVYDDGSGPALYAGGGFTIAGGAPANRIARWRDGAWSPLGVGVTDAVKQARVLELRVFDDGDGPALYAGGQFVNIGGVQSKGIARWDGAAWSAVGDSGVGVPGSSVVALASDVISDGGGEGEDVAPLWMGGDFSGVEGAPAGNIAAWRGCAGAGPGAGLPADINNDGVVNSLDLAILLGSWGVCNPPPQECPADINGDGVVNSADLALLLGFWGATAD